jgi:hypothetical protein
MGILCFIKIQTSKKIHRKNKPAVLWTDGLKYFYKNGQLQSMKVPEGDLTQCLLDVLLKDL